MHIQSLLLFLLIGAIAGWLSGLITRGGGFGIVWNVIIGTIGALIGGFLFKFFEIRVSGFIGSLITATAGAIILLMLIGLMLKKRRR